MLPHIYIWTRPETSVLHKHILLFSRDGTVVFWDVPDTQVSSILLNNLHLEHINIPIQGTVDFDTVPIDDIGTIRITVTVTNL